MDLDSPFGVVAIFGILDIQESLISKRHPFGIYAGLQEIFSMYAVRKILEISLLRPRKFRNFSLQQSPLFKLLWVCHRDSADPLHVTGVMLHFRHYKHVLLWSGAYLA